MAGIDDVLERLVTDAEFARNLARDPAGALAGYELTQDDLTLLSTQVSFDQGALSLVEERISKSSMFGLLTSITGGLAEVGDGSWVQGPSPHMSPGVVAPIDSQGVVAPIDSQGIVDPGDIGDPTGQGTTTHVIIESLVDDFEAPGDEDPGQGTLGDGEEVYFKEVEPGLPLPDAGVHGTGGGALGDGEEVYFKEVEPGVPPPEDGVDGIGGGAGLPNPAATQDFVFESGVDDPGIMPGGAEGIVVQGGLTRPEGIVVQGG